MISMALSKLLMAFSNLLAFMLVFPSRINKGATGFTRVARSRTSIACKSNKYLSQNSTTGNLFCRPGKATIVDNKLWDTMQCNKLSVFYNCSLKKAVPLPSNTMLKFSGGEIEAGEVVFASGVCANASKVQICRETFFHDCRFRIKNKLQL